MKKTLIKASILALAVGVAGGCATTEQIEEIKSMASSAQSAANTAQQRADNAVSVANQAMDAARAAQSAADAAMACCNDNTSRLDKMFEKAMQK